MTLSQSKIAALQQMGIIVWQDKSATVDQSNIEPENQSPMAQPARTRNPAQGLASLRAALGKEQAKTSDVSEPIAKPVPIPLVEQASKSKLFDDVYMALETVIGAAAKQFQWVESETISVANQRVHCPADLTPQQKRQLWLNVSQL